MHAHLGVRRARLASSKAFIVDADVHGFDGANFWIEDKSDGHGVEERGSLLAPLVIEQRQRVRKRSSLLEEISAFGLVELQLGRVKRHDVQLHPGKKEFLGGGNVIEDVPLRVGAAFGTEPQLAVATFDGAAHHDHAFEFEESCRVFVDQRANVHQRADGDQRDLAGITANLLEDEIRGAGMKGPGEVTTLAIAALIHHIGGVSGCTGEDRNVGAAGFAEEPVDDFGSGFGVSEGGGNAENLELRAFESEGDRKGVVDIVTDVRVDDDFLSHPGRPRGVLCLRIGARNHDHCEQSREDRKTHSASQEIYLGDTHQAARPSVQGFPPRESIAERASGKLNSGRFFFWPNYRKDYAARAEPKYWESGGV